MRRHMTWLAVCIAALALVPPAAAATHYTVRPGDTLTGIARRYHTSLGRVARMNHLQPYGVLRIGAVLRVPGRARHHHHHHHRRRHHRRSHRRQLIVHVVRPGETLSGIAARHHISLTRLARLNHRPAYGILVIEPACVCPCPGTDTTAITTRIATTTIGGTMDGAAAARAPTGAAATWCAPARRSPGWPRSTAPRCGAARANHLRIHGFLLVGTVLRVTLHGHRGRPHRHHPRHHRRHSRSAAASRACSTVGAGTTTPTACWSAQWRGRNPTSAPASPRLPAPGG